MSEVTSEDGEVHGLTVSDLESSNDEGGHGCGELSGDGRVDLKEGSKGREGTKSVTRPIPVYAFGRVETEQKNDKTHGHSDEVGEFGSSTMEERETKSASSRRVNDERRIELTLL